MPVLLNITMLISPGPRLLGLPSLQCSEAPHFPCLSPYYLPVALLQLQPRDQADLQIITSLPICGVHLYFFTSLDIHSLAPSADLLAAAIPVLQYVASGHGVFRELGLQHKDSSRARVPGRVSSMTQISAFPSTWCDFSQWKNLGPTVNRDLFLFPSVSIPETQCRLWKA